MNYEKMQLEFFEITNNKPKRFICLKYEEAKTGQVYSIENEEKHHFKLLNDYGTAAIQPAYFAKNNWKKTQMKKVEKQVKSKHFIR